MGPWRAPCQLKKPFKGPRHRRGSCREERKKIVFPWWGVNDLPSRHINDFFTHLASLIFDCLQPPWPYYIKWWQNNTITAISHLKESQISLWKCLDYTKRRQECLCESFCERWQDILSNITAITEISNKNKSRHFQSLISQMVFQSSSKLTAKKAFKMK